MMKYVSQAQDNSIITKFVTDSHAVVLEKGISEEWEVASTSPDLVPYTPPPEPVPDIDALRRKDYQQEADPIFFKWQRGEATEAEWLAKIAEIRARYPDAVGQ